jgi:hypothetical protein
LQVELCLMQIASIDEEKKKKLHKTFWPDKKPKKKQI